MGKPAPDGSGGGADGARAGARRFSWRQKAALQRMLSALPGGHRMNFALQRYLTHGVPIPTPELQASARLAEYHITSLGRASGGDLSTALFFEFGAGHDLHMPLAFRMLGVEHQVVVDVRRLARLDLVADAAERLFDGSDLWGAARVRGGSRYGSLSDFLSGLGIDYRAPCDARATHLGPQSVDFITSTNTLEHIPPADIGAILCECHRILKQDGLMSFQIDYMDHYAYFDPTISVYNFLRFDERTWRRYNSSLQYQNRLRHSEYLALLGAAGFTILEADLAPVTDTDLQALGQLPLAAPFKDMDPVDVAIRDARFLVSKSDMPAHASDSLPALRRDR
jgi:SAM-dependent methyltransferase